MNTGEDKIQGTSILVTGENGFIANNFIRLTQFGNYRKVSLKNKNVAEIDFTDIDVVLHLAALVHDKSIDEASYSLINRDLTINLAQAAKNAGVKHFIFMSTSKVFGEGGPGIIYNEDSVCNPSGPYGKSKLEAELLLQNLADKSYCVSVVRTPVVYGSGMKANMQKLKSLIKYMPFLPLGGIENKRCYTYVGNLVKYIDRIIGLRIPGVFIAMDTDPVSTTDLVKIMSRCMQRKVLLVTIPMPIRKAFRFLSETNYERLYGSFILDNSWTRRLLSLEPPFSTEEGFCKMIRDI